VNVADVAERLQRFFEEHQRRFAVIGGFGLLAHGIQRATFDLDLLVEVDFQPPLVSFLESLGYTTLHRSAGYSNHVHPTAELGRLDFVYVDGETAEQIFSGASVRPILKDIAVLVPRPEHLAAMKARAIKNDPDRKLQDLADIRQICRLPGVDRQEIRGYFDRLGLTRLYDEIEDES
jgi:hypothetical protein